ncbi:uncharacterized protein LY79DRAFT_318317 [Colletotrichum navitas]|uniref:Zn(2)-C6 fungal-type domain-containing protein n=1 Tax=Colletotrichum navitas TaxID=681940 RepID=A0AAD8PTY8_9PEZI|nr:uncharacterized protein LY79DRAFT_318317 [Colletotrichum navitas]KAK1580049.1 hypothetical protein LY79DRAFT_318317 [Colletotrichum navitas]
MARRGITRVKTGCATCKTRRIKCDEKRPSCSRCLSTGRRCDGYSSPPSNAYWWAQMLRSRPRPMSTTTLPNVDNSAAAGRAMHFYHTVAAPALTGSLSETFWRAVVVQVSSREPVAGHAVLALASLYETFATGARRPAPFAVGHYNKAIGLLRSTRDPALVLFVCVLFICIELLRNNPRNAIAHCRHGINILNEVQAESDFLRHHVVPAMHQLSLAPYCYDADPKTFPTINRPVPSAGARLESVVEARMRQITIQIRTARFLQTGEERRLAAGYEGPEPDRVRTQKSILVDLDSWHSAFQALKAAHQLDDKEHAVLCLLEIRYILNRTLLLLSETTSENEYDAYMDDYRAVVDLAARATASPGDGGPSRTTQFYTDDSAIELSFGPLLYLVVSKCRSLTVRIAALKLMEQLARPRVNIWVKSITGAVARRIIEVEHQISLGDLDMSNFVDDGELPPEERRVISVDFRWAADTESGGSLRQVGFLFRDPGSGKIISRGEWINVEH